MVASHIVREFMDCDFYNLNDLAKQLKADYFGVVPMNPEKEDEKESVPKKIVYMAYMKEDTWAAGLQYTVLITFGFLEKEEVWTRITEENKFFYASAMMTMLNLYEKQDYPELLDYGCEPCIVLDGISEVTEDMIRDAVMSYVKHNGMENEEEYLAYDEEYLPDDEDIPF